MARMDYGRMFRVIDKCHDKCGRNKFSLFFDAEGSSVHVTADIEQFLGSLNLGDFPLRKA